MAKKLSKFAFSPNKRLRAYLTYCVFELITNNELETLLRIAAEIYEGTDAVAADALTNAADVVLTAKCPLED